MLISASFLSAENKKKAVDDLNNTDVDYIHIDYMDGKFVEQKTGTFNDFKNALKDNKKPLDVHLMSVKNKSLIDKFSMMHTEFITIHVELDNVEEYIEQIKNYGLKVGISIKPDTSIGKVYQYLKKIDQVLIMSVYPGKGGQSFINTTYEKVRVLKEKIAKENLNIIVSVDGGINEETIKELNSDMAVSGSFITNATNYQTQINKLRQ